MFDLRRRAYPVLVMQSTVVVFIAVIAGVILGLRASSSVLLGGLICLIPQGLFAQWVLKLNGACLAGRIVQRFFVGQALKMLMTGLLFYSVFYLLSVNVTALLVGYMSAYLAFMFAPILIGTRKP